MHTLANNNFLFFFGTLFVLLSEPLSRTVVEGVQVFDVYRMLQYQRENATFGSHRTNVNFLATSVQLQGMKDNESLAGLGDLSRRVIVLRMKDLLPENEVLYSLFDERKAGGILVLLENTTLTDKKVQKQWQDFESHLILKNVPIPFYFAFNNEELDSLYTDLTATISNTGANYQYQLMVSTNEPNPLTKFQLTNIQGLLRGSNAKGLVVPTIAIVAYYDTLGISPELSTGTDSNGSGVTALLEMARLFSKLYYGTKTQGGYNILFVLTSGGRLNFAGTQHWIKELDPKIRESLEFALCLDSIGSSDGLNLHIAKSVQNVDEGVRKLYQELENQAKKMNIPFEIIHKKINIQNTDLDWEHQQFSLSPSERKVVSATLSEFKNPSPLFTRSNILIKAIQ
jgi:hypothetical protein